ncbi:MAG TPA: sulfotransferase [Acidimicrobiia bacterium]
MTGRRPRVLLLTGYSRSGSTLLARILGEIDGFVSPGELRHVWQRGLVENRRCDCGEPCLECPFWQKVLIRAFGSAPPPDVEGILELQRRVDRVYRIPALTRRLGALPGDVATYLRYHEHLYQAIEEVTGASWIVDSSKDPSFGHVLALSGEIDLAVVHLLRDSRAVAYSWTRDKHDPGTGKSMSRQHPLRSALEWDIAQWAASRLTGRVTRAMTLRYEDLVAEPEAAVEEVLTLIGGPAAPSLHGNRVQLTPGHAVSGNPMRFESGVVTISEDDQWREALPASTRRIVTTFTWPVLSTHGYLGGDSS